MTSLCDSYNETILKFLTELVDGQPKTADVSQRLAELKQWLQGSDAEGNKNSASPHLASTFYKQVSPHIESVKTRNFEVLCGSKLLADFGVSQFLKYLDPGDKEKFGGWVEGLCANAEMIAAGGSQQAKLAAYAEELVLEMDRQQNFDSMKPEDVQFAITSGIMNSPAAIATTIEMLMHATEQDQDNMSKWAGPLMGQIQNMDTSVSEAELMRTLGLTASAVRPPPPPSSKTPAAAAADPAPTTTTTASLQLLPVDTPPAATNQQVSASSCSSENGGPQQTTTTIQVLQEQTTTTIQAVVQQEPEEEDRCLQPLPVDDDNHNQPTSQDVLLLQPAAPNTPSLLHVAAADSMSATTTTTTKKAAAPNPQQPQQQPPVFAYGSPQQFGNPQLQFPMPSSAVTGPMGPLQQQQQPLQQQQQQPLQQQPFAPQEQKSVALSNGGVSNSDFLRMLGGAGAASNAVSPFHLPQPSHQPSIQAALSGGPQQQQQQRPTAQAAASSSPFGSPVGPVATTGYAAATPSRTLQQQPSGAAAFGGAAAAAPASNSSSVVSPFGVSLGNAALSPQTTKDKIREISERQQQQQQQQQQRLAVMPNNQNNNNPTFSPPAFPEVASPHTVAVVDGLFSHFQVQPGAPTTASGLAAFLGQLSISKELSAEHPRDPNRRQQQQQPQATAAVVDMPSFLAESNQQGSGGGRGLPLHEAKGDMFATASPQPMFPRNTTVLGGGAPTLPQQVGMGGRAGMAVGPGGPNMLGGGNPFGGGGGGGPFGGGGGGGMPDLSSMMSTMMSNPALMQSLMAAMMGQPPPPSVPAPAARPQTSSTPMHAAQPVTQQAPLSQTTMPSYEALLQEWQTKQPPHA